MNRHHLELFYFVAKHRGLSRALPHIPWGIQLPALSAQISQLEKDCGEGPLFVRKPFQLLPTGAALYDRIRPAYDALLALQRLDGTIRQRVRIAAAPVVFTSYLGDVFRVLQTRFPNLQVRMISTTEEQRRELLCSGEIDAMIGSMEGEAPEGINCTPLVALPIALIAHRRRRLTDAKQLWATARIMERLIVPESSESVTRRFERGLARMGITWEPTFFANSLGSVRDLVIGDVGIGVTVDVPTLTNHPELRVLPLLGFEFIDIALYNRSPPSEFLTLLLQLLVRRAKADWPACTRK